MDQSIGYSAMLIGTRTMGDSPLRTINQQEDGGSVRSASSTKSALSLCLNQLVKKQQAERSRVALALQRRHLDEQQILIDDVLRGEIADSNCGGSSFRAANKAASPARSRRLPIPHTPGAPLATSVRRSSPLLDTPRTIAPPTISIALAVPESSALRSLQESKQSQDALQEIRKRDEQCEKRAESTPEKISALYAQLEMCRDLLEGIQSGAETSGSFGRSDASDPVEKQLPKLAESKPRLEKQSSTIPTATRTVRHVPEEGWIPERDSAAGVLEDTNPVHTLWPLRNLVSQTGLPPVSRPSEADPNRTEPPGKRHALNQIYEPSHYHCPTTNNHVVTREQPRIHARPGESRIPPTNFHKQLRESLARSGGMKIPTHSLPEPYSIDEQTRQNPSRTVGSSQPPRQSEDVHRTQEIPPPATTPHQLAARQSLAKKLARFSDGPAELIFISHYRYTIEICGFLDGRNMLRLQRCLTGPAQETVRNRLVLLPEVPLVIETLRIRFGHPELLINALLRKMREGPAPRSDSLEVLTDFRAAVQALYDHIEAANERAHLLNPSLLHELVVKHTADQQTMWAGYKRGLQHAYLKSFGDHMASVVQDAISVVTFEPEVKRDSTRDRPYNKGVVNTHTISSPDRSEKSSRELLKHIDCLNCNKSGHRVRDCEAFKELNVDDRWRRVRMLHLCPNFLLNHGQCVCWGQKTCDIEGCQFRHDPPHSLRGPTKARLDWRINGHRGSSNRESYSIHVRECESNGVGLTGTPPTKKVQRTLTALEITTRQVANRFEMRLLWKEDRVELSDSYSMAMHRDECVKHRIDRDPELKETLHRQIREYEGKATKEEIEVANPRRVSKMLGHTTAALRRWIPSISNPANEATIWRSGPDFDHISKWFQGHNCLRLSEEEQLQASVTATAEEMCASILLHCLNDLAIDFDRFSSWERLQWTPSYVLRVLHNASKKQPKYSGPLQQPELPAAEETILKLVQRESYPDEVAALWSKTPNEAGQDIIGKHSSIYQLMPILDDNGLLRERGRIGVAENVSYGLRHPLILPRKHRVTDLLVNRYHRNYRHGNAETVVNEVRQLYMIPRLRLVVKKVKRDCAFFKIRQARPVIPPMAPLPAARLAHHERPFTYTVDYFGPLALLAKLGRSNGKRWIALFTYLTVRAVHLEVAYTLSTESCIFGVHRFVGRRRRPAEYFSDNGTHLQGADRVLQHQISQGLSAMFTSVYTKWRERLVQSVKAAIAEAHSEGKLIDGGLQTLVVEAESVVNSRPLTYLPLESEKAEALTLNHLRLMSSNQLKQVSEGSEATVQVQFCELVRRQISGRSCELIQRQLQVCWKRQLNDYLLVIRREPKWFEETQALESGDLEMVTEPAKQNRWERVRIIFMTPDLDGRYRRATMNIEGKAPVRPVTWLALLDMLDRRGVTEDSGLHPGETVNVGIGELATLSTGVSEGSAVAVNASR